MKIPTDRQIICQKWLFNLAFQYAYKVRWNSKHRIPGWRNLQNETRQGVKALGDLMVKTIDLTMQLHYHHPHDYAHAGVWSQRIFLELENFMLSLEPKDIAVRSLKARVGEIRRHENPFDAVKEIHSYRLIEAAITTAATEDLFRRNYWQLYKRSWSAFIVDVKINPGWIATFVQNETLVYHPKQGKFLTPLP